MDEDLRARVQRLAARALAEGRPTGWFEELYQAASGDEAAVPWQGNPFMDLAAEWLDALPGPGEGGRALVVGCGLGDHAEALAARGWDTTGFDVSPRAVEWARLRHDDSPVRYRVADLLDPPEEWRRAFDLVLEIVTLQALPADTRARAFAPLADLVAPGGHLLAVGRLRDAEEPDPGPPWALTREELARLEEEGLTELRFEDRVTDAGSRRFRLLSRREPA